MLNRTGKLAAAIAITMLALPAAAGSPPNFDEVGDAVASQYRYFPNEEKTHGKKSFARSGAVPQRFDTAGADTRSVNGFEYVGGEAGWQLSQHKYVWIAGRFAHSDECDHAIRMAAKAPTPGEMESARKLYGGG